MVEPTTLRGNTVFYVSQVEGDLAQNLAKKWSSQKPRINQKKLCVFSKLFSLVEGKKLFQTALKLLVDLKF